MIRIPDEDRTITVTDPVCGVEINLDDAKAHEVRDGWTHFFCSTACHEKFRNAPGRYFCVPR